MNATETKTAKYLTFFLDADRKLHKLCTKKHKTGICGRFHEIPSGTLKILWQGTISANLVGEFREALREYKKQFKKDTNRWTRHTQSLNAKVAAPAFSAYLQKIKDDHLKAKPIFNFSYTERPELVINEQMKQYLRSDKP